MTIIDLVTQRLGGSNFDKGIRYKFEKIKSIKKRLEESGKSILDFGIGEPYGCPPEIATKTLSAACSEKRYNQYADNGASFFKESVARFMKKYYQVENS